MADDLIVETPIADVGDAASGAASDVVASSPIDSGAAQQNAETKTTEIASTADGKTIVDGAASAKEGDSTDAKSDWPENWRELGAKGDEKLLKRLQRYNSPVAAIDALIAAQNKISSGDLKSVLKADASPEEVSKWREENGIPESSDGYDTALPDGLVIGENDKPLVGEFLKDVAHKNNFTPAQAKEVLAWHYANQEKQQHALKERDTHDYQENRDALISEFGGVSALKENMSRIQAMFNDAPEGLAAGLFSARLPNGRLLGNDPDALRYLSKLSHEIDPAATVVPGAGANSVQAIGDEINKLNSMMRDRSSEYWSGPNASENQQRYRDLVDAQNKINSRNK